MRRLIALAIAICSVLPLASAASDGYRVAGQVGIMRFVSVEPA